MNYSVNKTTLFLLPLLEVKHSDLFGLFNCYIKREDAEVPTSKYTILIMFDAKIATYKTLERMLSHPNVTGHIVNKHTIIVTVALPVTLHRAYDLWLDGRYSKLSDDEKNAILAFWLRDSFAISNVRKDARLYKMLYPTAEDKTAVSTALDTKEPILEIVSKPCMLEETFLLSDVFQLVK